MKPADRTPIEKLEFRGAIGNMPFRSITMNQFINALKLNGWREGSETRECHFYKSLVERGPGFGITTLNEFARALRTGLTQPAKHGRSRRVCCGGACWVIFEDNEFFTIRHPKDE
jgi:hypothetical protein